MKVQAIVYTSHTGFTARYAALLGEETGLPVYELKQAEAALDRGAEIIYLGWLCAGSIHGLEKAARRFGVKGICAVGMAPPHPAYIAKLRRPERLWEVPLFYLRGGYAPEKLRGIYKLMMGFMTKKVLGTPAESPEERAMQEVFRAGGDFVEAQNLAQVLNWLEAEK